MFHQQAAAILWAQILITASHSAVRQLFRSHVHHSINRWQLKSYSQSVLQVAEAQLACMWSSMNGGQQRVCGGWV